MKRSAIRSLIVAALPLFVFVVILMSKTNKVYAALPGEDGVIVSVEVPADSTGSVTQIVATNPDTGTTTTVATVDSENAAIESVTVSAPSGTSVANQTNDVVFGQVNYTDNEDARYEIDLKKVTIDAEGNPTTSVTDLATIPSQNGYVEYAESEDLSYSPDSSNVLATSYFEGEGSWTQLDKVDTATGAVTNIITDNTYNPTFLNGGYAADGTIYFSQWHPLSGGEFPDYGSDIFKITSGKTYADREQVTFTDEYDEVYLDAAPDSSTLLVYCFADWERSSSIVEGYYKVDTATGNITYVATDDSDRLAFFSPKGSRLAGVQDDYQNFKKVTDDEMVMPQLATFSTNGARLSGLRAINAMHSYLGFDSTFPQMEWAPKLAVATPPQVLGSSTTVSKTPVLQNTGSTAALPSLIAGVVVAGVALAVAKKQEN
jgi:hypothetical protein